MKIKFTVETTYEDTPATVPEESSNTGSSELPPSPSTIQDFPASMTTPPHPQHQNNYQYPPPTTPPTKPPPHQYPYHSPPPPPYYPPSPASPHPPISPPPPHPPTHQYPYPPQNYSTPSFPPAPASPHYPPSPAHQYPPTVAEVNSAEKKAAILIICLVGLQLLPAPTWEKIENLPPAQILRSIVNPAPNQSVKKQSSIQSHGPPIFPLAGISGKDAVAGSIPGDCRPLGSCSRKHAGVDYSATPGWPVLAVEGGTVNEVKPDSPVGGIIGIQSERLDEIYRYVHLDRDSVRPFKVGDFVPKGSVIGLIGPTFPGSSGPHGHFERYLNGKLDWKIHEHLKKAIAVSKP